jgi:hypothetical protein
MTNLADVFHSISQTLYVSTRNTLRPHLPYAKLNHSVITVTDYIRTELTFEKNTIKPPLDGNMMSEIKYANVMLDMNVTKSGRHLSNECVCVYIYIYIVTDFSSCVRFFQEQYGVTRSHLPASPGNNVLWTAE